MTRTRIKENVARCKVCDDILYSRHKHDRQTCSCGAVQIDGGLVALKRSGRLEDREELSTLEVIADQEPHNPEDADSGHDL